ncbi:MAG TPA: hypothetical protein VM471_08680 [Phenylobacterium sp.]|nr:hypothetical protein [Phenylobacterium sp.]
MRRLTTSIAAVLMIGAGSAQGAATSDLSIDDDCEVVRIAGDGTRTVTPPVRPTAKSRTNAGPATASVSARSSGSSSSSSSVRASSRSGAEGGSAVATSTTNDGRRTVTTTRNAEGCTVVIDERPN